ncbi:MAG: ASPIC/UnbV domain-containing protein [Acidobacteriota bacterium]
MCFDYDLDGDVDILVGNNRGSSRLFRNDLLSVGAPPVDSAHWLAFDLRQPGGNGYAVGAEVRVQVGGQEQLRQVQAGNNFLSQNPLEVHFGLGDAPAADRVEVRWPDGGIAVLENVAANRTVVLSRGAPAVEIPIVSPGGLVVLAALLAGLALSRLRSAA